MGQDYVRLPVFPVDCCVSLPQTQHRNAVHDGLTQHGTALSESDGSCGWISSSACVQCRETSHSKGDNGMFDLSCIILLHAFLLIFNISMSLIGS